MDEWKYDPAHDLGLTETQRARSVRRESGLIGVMLRNGWWWFLRAYFATCQRVIVEGCEHLPAAPPFLVVANHASHLDTLVLACVLPLKLRNRAFPIAAGDTFFETPTVSLFAAGLINALPMWRKNAGRHAMEELRSRLVEEPCGYILFPEGTRSRTGEMGSFRTGVGMLIAQTQVPVIPCHLFGTFEALPAQRKIPRRANIRVRIGESLSFSHMANKRECWEEIARVLEGKVRALADQPNRPVT
jgi:1-acyl-sn-glycerol-3-phosphate acyltransferase